MDRVKRISMLLLERNPDLFTDDFQKNKGILADVAVVRSKELRNRVAGYITALVKELRAKAGGEEPPREEETA